jgi:probable HAF family extracellular repeat protein
MIRLRTSHLVPLAALALAAGLAAAAAPASAAATPAYTVTDLGTLGGAGAPQTQPEAINASGQVTGFSYTPTVITQPCGHYKPPRTCSFHPQHAFLYSNGTMTDLGSLGGPSQGSTGFAINSSGQVAGLAATATAGVVHAAWWTGTTTVDLGALAPLSAGSWSAAFGINDSGQLAGSWAPSQITRGTASHPWLYSNGTMTSLPVPSGLTAPSCEAIAINNNGQILGDCTTASGAGPALLWHNGTVTTLATLGGLHVTYATAINNNGQIAGYGTTSTGATQGFLDSNGTVTNLGSFTPFALNDNAVMVDGTDQINTGGTIQNLNNLIPANSGYTIQGTEAINDNGQITATTTTGHALLLTPN